LQVEDLSLQPPRAGEIRVSLRSSGVCHSDLSAQAGTLPAEFPIVLGHQGAGMVTAVGEDVAGFRPGDYVLIAPVAQCGECPCCRRGEPFICERGARGVSKGQLLDGTTRLRTLDGREVRQLAGVGTFSQETVIPAISAVPLPASVPPASAAVLGCAVLTGAGAAINTAAVQAGATVAVLGCGPVGLAAIQGARVRGAERIIAIDIRPEKLAIAESLGATHVIASAASEPVAAVRHAAQGRGVDVAIEAAGLAGTTAQAVAMTRRGGLVVLVGAGGPEVRLDLPTFGGVIGRALTIKGCYYGSCDIRRDVPFLVDRYLAGELKLDELVSTTVSLDQLNDAFQSIARGRETAVTVALP
jgi:Zn-dependent alcohol dehydrogenase